MRARNITARQSGLHGIGPRGACRERHMRATSDITIIGISLFVRLVKKTVYTKVCTYARLMSVTSDGRGSQNGSVASLSGTHLHEKMKCGYNPRLLPGHENIS
jgi:hypothetical protein